VKNNLQNKTIVLGITGSISAYKAPFLIRLLKKEGADVHCIITEAAKKFVTEDVLANLSGNHVISDMFDREYSANGAWHVSLAHKCDAMIIAPCSASSLGKLANGICDTALIVLAMALPRATPLVLSPAMDYTMWENPATMKNIEILKSYGYHIIEPEDGELSSGLTGMGRLPEPLDLVENLKNILLGENRITNKSDSEKIDKIDEDLKSSEHAKVDFDAEMDFEKLKSQSKLGKLSGKNILITAGPTVEKIDDVRFISNFSSGKMGYSLAETARDAGGNITLISGKVSLSPPDGVKTIITESAREMHEEVLRLSENQDIFIMSAAVADYRSKEIYSGKIKKENSGDALQLNLMKNPDILRSIGENKKSNQIICGFALESSDGEENAIKKLESKNCDLIVLNMANKKDSGFSGDKNTITIINKNRESIYFEPMGKRQCAQHILENISSLL
jgi:phosphopantothenoylcysteine decarboxylase / phosphopantothenate---cysteine ligase